VSLNLTAHTLFNPNFRGVPVAPDRPCWASARAEALSYSAVELFSKNSNLCCWYLNVTDGRTDGQLTVASPRSALASRGKNINNCNCNWKILVTVTITITEK